MKSLLIFTLYLISGPVSCFEVTGYSGGSVIIVSDLKSSVFAESISKLEPQKCINSRNPITRGDCVYDPRFRLYKNRLGFTVVSIRGLNLKDTGFYRIGVGTLYRDMELKIISSSCCGGSETRSVSQGETVNISCSYPDQFQNHFKSIFKLEDDSIKEIADTGTVTQRGRFSISDDRGSRVITVRIRDVGEDDGGVYSCAVWTGVGSMGYYSLFTEIQLQVTARQSTPTPAPPTPTPPRTTVIISDEEPSRSSIFIIVIIIIICAVLPLIGGLTLIFYCMLHKKKQGSTDDSSGVELKDNKQAPPVVSIYEEIKPIEDLPDSDTGVNANASTTAPSKDQDPIYSTLTPPKSQDLIYSTLTPPKGQDLIYSTPTPPKGQDLIYSTPTPPKGQDLIYSTPTPPKGQDLIYSTSTPPKGQDLTYSTLTPPKGQELTYSTVNFHNNSGCPTDASVSVSKEKPETEYSIVKQP